MGSTPTTLSAALRAAGDTLRSPSRRLRSHTHLHTRSRTHLHALLHPPLPQVRLGWPPLAWAAILLLGLGLRALLWNAFPFREDEAIYSTWALQAWNGDPFFLVNWPDKPPLFLWILGGAFRLFGPQEGTARWLNILLSTATIPVTALTARRLWGRWAGWVAGLALALNPFAISFAPTAYTDPMLVLWGSLALYAAVVGRGFRAGLWLGAAIMTKQQGLLYAPLILGMLAASAGPRSPAQEASLARRLGSFALGLASITGPILLWDSLRWSVAPSPWDLSLRHYGPLGLLPPAQWLPRLREWGQLAWHLTASTPVWALLVVGGWLLGVRIWYLRVGSDLTPPPFPLHPWRGKGVASFASRGRGEVARSLGLLLLLWSLAYFALHVTTSVQIWDRYLLPLAPMLALGMGWMVQEAVSWLGGGLGSASRPLVGLLGGVMGVALLLGPAWTAAQGGLPVGGDHGDYAGLREAVAWLKAEAPADAVIYHRVLGWHFRYYLFRRTGPQGMELRWFPSTVYLADNAAKTPHRRKFLVQPDWAPLRDAPRRLAQRGLRWERRFRQGRFTVYELVTPPQPPCDWCFNAPGTARPAFSPWPVLELPPSAPPPLSEARHAPSTR